MVKPRELEEVVTSVDSSWKASLSPSVRAVIMELREAVFALNFRETGGAARAGSCQTVEYSILHMNSGSTTLHRFHHAITDFKQPSGSESSEAVLRRLLASRVVGGRTMTSDDPAPGSLIVFQYSLCSTTRRTYASSCCWSRPVGASILFPAQPEPIRWLHSWKSRFSWACRNDSGAHRSLLLSPRRPAHRGSSSTREQATSIFLNPPLDCLVFALLSRMIQTGLLASPRSRTNSIGCSFLDGCKSMLHFQLSLVPKLDTLERF